MKNKIITVSIIAIIIMALTSVCYAATGTVEVKASKAEVKKGDTFTVTLVATSEEGINGVNSQYSYNTEKLDLISGAISNDWSNLGTAPEITIVCNSEETIKNADIYTLTFKVKDTVTKGETLQIEFKDIILGTDLETNAELQIGTKTAEVKIIEEEKQNELTNNNTNIETNKNNTTTNNNNTNKNNTTTNNNSTNKDTSTSNNKLPQTGISNTVIYTLIIVTTICAIICYKKYIEHKDIK